MSFWTKFAQKGYFRPKKKKWTSLLNFVSSNYSRYQILAETDHFDFLDQICSKSIFSVIHKKSEYPHWILDTGISLVTKFHFKQTIFYFGAKVAQKGYFWSKTKQLNITIEFCIFKLVNLSNFSLNTHFWFFRPNLPKKWYFQCKIEKSHLYFY